MLPQRFELQQTRQAERDLLRLRPWTARATNELLILETNPYRGHTLSGSLKGACALEFSLPGGEYRAAYLVRENVPKQDDPNETESFCLVFLVGPHENFYGEAERRLKALRKSGAV
ncbi:MAG: type II toxin-antitoxin system RelE/ParE family toxin [Armatimonadetes bacterium]|nr:type II toxin-antitoxin system RelE/ParE family toxin [Armatimonadota bacterium]